MAPEQDQEIRALLLPPLSHLAVVMATSHGKQ